MRLVIQEGRFEKGLVRCVVHQGLVLVIYFICIYWVTKNCVNYV